MQPPDPLTSLLRGLDLEEVRSDVFRARTGRGAERLFEVVCTDTDDWVSGAVIGAP